MDGTCGRHGRDENFFSGKQKRRDNLSGLGVDGKIIYE
jgi:hypothetical protein